MTTQTYVKTYGIYRNCKGRYAIATDISDDKKYYFASDTLTYANPEFASKKSFGFITSLYRDFVNFQGVKIHFEFKDMGLIN
jgi:hypothetical protein